MRRPVVLLASATLALTGLAAAAPTASAATTCRVGAAKVSSAPVVVGTKYKKTKSISVKITNCSPADRKGKFVGWHVGESYPDTHSVALTGTYDGDNVYTFKGAVTFAPYNGATFNELINDDAGTSPSEIIVYYGPERAHNKAPGPNVKLLRATRFANFGASPEPVKKGKIIFIKGQLQRATWNTDRYLNYASAEPMLQFKPKGGNYRDVERLYWGMADGSLKGGGYYTEVKATVDGCFRIVYKGNSVTGPKTSAADCVDVR